jgi:hypothetical protein
MASGLIDSPPTPTTTDTTIPEPQPEHPGFWSTKEGKVLKAALWSAGSAFVAGLVVWLVGDLSVKTFIPLVLVPTLNTFGVILKTGLDSSTPSALSH